MFLETDCFAVHQLEPHVIEVASRTDEESIEPTIVVDLVGADEVLLDF